MTYREWYTLYLSLYKRDLAAKTLESYAQISRDYILPSIGSVPIEELTPEHVQLAINAARGARSAQQVYQLIHAVRRRAARSRLIAWNPAEAIDKPQYDEEQGKALTDADLRAASPLIGGDLSLSLALWAGLRRGEIVGLQWGDVSLSGGFLRVRRQRVRVGGALRVETPKSTAGLRDIPIAPQLLPLLRSEYRLSPRAWVVDVAPETPYRRWQRLQQRELLLSQPYRLHDLRHTYGSQLILSGCNLRVVQYLMGHSTIDVTMRVYSHVDADQARREAQRVYAAALH